MKSLNNKILSIVSFICVIPLFITYGITTYYIKEEADLNQSLWLTDRNQSIVSSLNDFLKERTYDISTIINNPTIMRKSETKSISVDITKYLESFVNAYGYSKLLLVSEKGKIIYSYGKNQYPNEETRQKSNLNLINNLNLNKELIGPQFHISYNDNAIQIFISQYDIKTRNTVILSIDNNKINSFLNNEHIGGINSYIIAKIDDYYYFLSDSIISGEFFKSGQIIKKVPAHWTDVKISNNSTKPKKYSDQFGRNVLYTFSKTNVKNRENQSATVISMIDGNNKKDNNITIYLAIYLLVSLSIFYILYGNIRKILKNELKHTMNYINSISNGDFSNNILNKYKEFNSINKTLLIIGNKMKEYNQDRDYELNLEMILRESNDINEFSGHLLLILNKTLQLNSISIYKIDIGTEYFHLVGQTMILLPEKIKMGNNNISLAYKTDTPILTSGDILLPQEINSETCPLQLKSKHHMTIKLSDSLVFVFSGNIKYTTKQIDSLYRKKEQITRLLDYVLNKEEVDHLIEKLKNNEIELSKANKLLQISSATDELTNLYNKSCGINKLNSTIINRKSTDESISVLFIDIDFFKKYNDTYGHLKGDQCLSTIAKIIKKQSRKEDIIFRFGGEEFVVALPNTTSSNARFVAEKISNSIAEYKICHDASSISKYITVSIGIYTSPPESDEDSNKILEHADKALYIAKNKRNTIHSAN